MKKILCVFLGVVISMQPVFAADMKEKVSDVTDTGYIVHGVSTKGEKVATGTDAVSTNGEAIVTNSTKGEKIAAATGAVIGGASAVGAVSTLGVAGLGATGVTSGLAAVGGVVGGGMVAGLAVTAAAPVIVGGAAYGIYKKLFKKKK